MTRSRNRTPPTATHAALGALIAARRGAIGVHVIECQPGQFDVVMRLDGPWTNSGDAHRAARWLADIIGALLPGPPNTIGSRNPRPTLIRPHQPARKAK